MIIIMIILPWLVVFATLILKNSYFFRHVINIFLIGSFTIYTLYSTINFNHANNIKIALLELMPNLKIEFYIEFISLIFMSMFSLLWLVTYIYSIGYFTSSIKINSTKLISFYLYMSMAMACTTLLSLSANLFTLFIFYELLTILTYPLVTFSKTPEAYRAGKKYLYYLLLTSIGLLLPAIIITYTYANNLDFTIDGIIGKNISPTIIFILLSMYIIGTAKCALLPVYAWLPSAMVAPIPVSALLHAVAVVKAGVFTIIKILFYIFDIKYLHELIQQFGIKYNLIQIIAVLTILVASLIALKQRKIKSVLAYSTISQLSYCIMAASLFSTKAIAIATFQMIAHAIAKITLFFAAGNIEKVSNIKDTKQMIGIARIMPLTMIMFTICASSIIGLPFTVGFMSKYYIINLAISDNNISWIVLITTIIGSILSAAYFIPIIFAAFSNKDTNSFHNINSLPLTMYVATFIGTLFVIILFIYAYKIMFWINNFLNQSYF